MLKLFSTHNGNLFKTLKSQSKNPKFHIPISRLHSPNKTLISNPAIQFILDEAKELESSKNPEPKTQLAPKNIENFEPNGSKVVQISHPWPEWVELMEMLMKRGYFEGFGNPFSNGEMGMSGVNFIGTTCLNFARDRFDLMRHLSRKDIQVVAESGCPIIDMKVVNSGKRLRAHVGIDEGNVCSSCILRGNCERADVKAREDEGSRTVDVMCLLITYGLDPITGLVENKACINKRVKESVRRLLKEMVELSMEELDRDPPRAIIFKSDSFIQGNSNHKGQTQNGVPMKQGDWMCPKCNFLNFARNIKCLRCDGLCQEKLRQLNEDQDHLPLKKGDWICDECNFLNFAKNTRCFQCKENPPKRQLNPGEWECESCNYVNFRKNMVCLKCDHRRPKAINSVSTSAQQLNDNGGYGHSQTFVRERCSAEEGVDMWKFVEDESEEVDGSKSCNEIQEFVDFPIAGGKSDLSKNLQKQERWKIEMAERSKSSSKAMENANQFKLAIIQRSTKFLETTDDEEMAEWFGHGKD